MTLLPTDDPGATRALDAPVERIERFLQADDRPTALILHVKQSKSLGLVIGDLLQQGRDLWRVVVGADVRSQVRCARESLAVPATAARLSGESAAKVGEYRAIERGHAVAEVPHAARQRLELLLHRARSAVAARCCAARRRSPLQTRR